MSPPCTPIPSLDRLRRTAAALLCALPSAPLLAQVAPPDAVPTTPAGGTFDNVRGNWILFETAPIAPLFVDTVIGKYVFAVNQPGLRLSIYELPAGNHVAEIPTGPGVVSAVGRDGTTEVWLVDSVTHSVSVVDVYLRTIVKTIDLAGTEPHGLVFHPSGDRAYVSCSGSDSVDVIDTATCQVVNSIPVPAMNPRGIAFADGILWVAPFLSGNNTTSWGPDGFSTSEVIEVTPQTGLNALPDRDLLGIVADPDPAKDALDPALTVTGLGTVLFNLHARPGTSELWIPNTEGLNAQFKGEKSFVGGQVVSNRVSVVDTATGQVKIVDLDQTAPPGAHCAQPSAVAFSPDGSRAYVAGYGSDVIAVLDADDPANGWLGFYRVPGTDDGDPLTEDRSGPRGLWTDAMSNALFVFNKADGSWSRVPLATTPLAGGSATAPISLGYDPTPAAVRRGRMHLISADHSKSGTSSCASCHVDGHLDGLIWELSRYLDPEGTPSDQLQFEVDVKGPMVTQSLRSLADTSPYHWRGEKKALNDFNGAFVGLLEREAGVLTDAEFADLEAYVLGLVYPANPRQDPGRAYVGAAGDGHFAFTEIKSNGVLSCSDCHMLPTGSSNEVRQMDLTGLALTTQVTQLRGLEDKLGTEYDLGGEIGALRTEQGLGTTHAGIFGTISGFVNNIAQTSFTPQEKLDVVTFIQELDTGLAPSTAWQATAAPQNGAEVLQFIQNDLAYLLSQLQAGHCDAVCYLQYEPLPGVSIDVNLAYDHALGLFRLPRAGWSVPPAALVHFAAAFGGHATFVGLPLGMGWRWGLDRDHDRMMDLDELALGTDPLSDDTDGDAFPDGYELLQTGMSPFVVETSSTDVTPPAVVDGPVEVFTRTNTAKIELTTSEPARVRVTHGGITTASPATGGWDANHTLIVPGLPPDETVRLGIELEDPAGNLAVVPFDVRTKKLARPFVARVAALDLISFDDAQGTALVRVTLSDQTGGSLTPGYTVDAFAYYEDDATPLTVISKSLVGLSDDFDQAYFPLAGVPLSGTPGTRKLHFGVTQVNKAGGIVYIEAEDVESFETYTF